MTVGIDLASDGSEGTVELETCSEEDEVGIESDFP